ncbi:MAG: hypothetical protein AB1547_11825, partial [Thermodesulfobacteriota bacterium]
KNSMLETTKPFFLFWPSARSYELGLLSFSAAEQNSPAFLRVNPEGLTFCDPIHGDGLAKSQAHFTALPSTRATMWPAAETS